MAQTLGSVGSFFSSPTGKGVEDLAGLGATGAGLVGNLAADRQRAAAAKQAEANAKLTPAQIGAQVTQATQPLNANLVQAVTGATNANMAEQGLSQAPGLQASAIAQGLAPFEQQNQQTALQAVLARLGLPAEFARTIPQNANLAPLLAMLFKNFSSGGGTTPTTPFSGAFNQKQPSLDQMMSSMPQAGAGAASTPFPWDTSQPPAPTDGTGVSEWAG